MRNLMICLALFVIGSVAFGRGATNNMVFTIDSSPTHVDSSSAANTLIVPANSSRKYLKVYKSYGSPVMYLSHSASISAGTHILGISIASSNSWEPSIAPGNAVYAYTVSGDVSATYISGE